MVGMMEPKTYKRRRKNINMSARTLDDVQNYKREVTFELVKEFYKPALTLGASKETTLAMDANLEEMGMYNYIYDTYRGNRDFCNNVFLGYAFLSTLAQDGLVRAGVETVADEMTRKWIELNYTGEELQSEQVLSDLMSDLEEFKLREIFHKVALWTGYFGGCLVYIDDGATTAEEKMRPLFLDKHLFEKDSLRGFTVIEPINVTPGLYNSSDPLKPDYFKPSSWWVQGQQVHASRLLYFAANETPIMLKPSYNFFGVPIAQNAVNFVNTFTKNREAASRLLNNFSLTALKVNMEGVLQGESGSSESLNARIGYFCLTKDNSGCMVIDKEDEDIIKLDTSLGGVDTLVSQSLELLASIFRIPVVKFLGLSPSGFNATGESDLRNYYDHVSCQQQKVFGENLTKVLKIIQLNRYGEYDKHIQYQFLPLGDIDERIQAETNRIKSEIDWGYLDRGFPSSMAIQRLSTDKGSGYSNVQSVESSDLIDIEPGQELEEGQTGTTGFQPKGIQIKSIQEIVMSVHAGEMPRESAVALLEASFPFTRSQVEGIVGDPNFGTSTQKDPNDEERQPA